MIRICFGSFFCQTSTAAGQSTLEVLVSAVALLCPTEGERDFSVDTQLSSSYQPRILRWALCTLRCILSLGTQCPLQPERNESLPFWLLRQPRLLSLLSLSFAASFFAKGRLRESHQLSKSLDQRKKHDKDTCKTAIFLE